MIQFDQHFSNGLKLNHQPGPTGGSCTAYDLYGMETWISSSLAQAATSFPLQKNEEINGQIVNTWVIDICLWRTNLDLCYSYASGKLQNFCFFLLSVIAWLSIFCFFLPKIEFDWRILVH